MSIEISDGILAGYLALSAVLLAIRYVSLPLPIGTCLTQLVRLRSTAAPV